MNCMKNNPTNQAHEHNIPCALYKGIKTHGSESRGQEAACMRVFWPMRPLQ